MKDALRFMQLVTQRFPSLNRRGHLLSLDGDRLVLTLFTGAQAPTFILDQADLERPLEELVDELAGLMVPEPNGPPSGGPVSAA